MNTVRKQPSEQGRIILASLKEAVGKALDKKRRLGQYAVVWENGEVVCKGEDAPKMERQQK